MGKEVREEYEYEEEDEEQQETYSEEEQIMKSTMKNEHPSFGLGGPPKGPWKLCLEDPLLFKRSCSRLDGAIGNFALETRFHNAGLRGKMAKILFPKCLARTPDESWFVATATP